MSYLPCPRCGEGFGCVCNTPTVGSADERVVRADRRERIATACLVELIAWRGAAGNADELSAAAVKYADALIEELDKEAKP